MLLFSIIALFLFSHASFGQCGANTPIFNVDLSTKADSLWTSPDTIRIDTCCGAVAPDKCVAFNLTLAPNATGIIFDICDGAIPPGALFYQVACGPISAVGQPLCLTGPGPHLITFCKPGNNNNRYCITSIPTPSAGGDLNVNDGCQDTLISQGYDPNTIQWTTVAPGPRGAYDSTLSCTDSCETTIAFGGPNLPAFIDVELCGQPIGGCEITPYCDTVRVNFFSTLAVNITPQNPTVCFGQTNTWIKANPTGGRTPYSFLWSNGATTDSIQVGVGTYIVQLSDSTGCPPAFDTVVVTAFANPIQALAGNDTTICAQDIPFQLNGSVIAAGGGRWSGGNGTFNPHDSALNAIYTPSPTEIFSGSVSLILTTTGNGTCPADQDTVTFTFTSFNATINSSATNLSCTGANDGTATINVTGPNAPFTYVWDANAGNQTTATINNLAPGRYRFTVTDVFGCTDTSSVVITEPTPLVASITASTNVSCNGGNDGSSTVTATGATPNYSYLWPSGDTNATDTALATGTYIVTVTDANGCTDTSSITITEPPLLVATISGSTNVSCNGGSDGTATATAIGGTGAYTFSWPSGGVNATEASLLAGTYIVTVTDANGCSDTASVTITEPTPVVSSIATPVNVSCNGGNDGSATATAVGGTGAYTFSWSSGGTAANETGLPAGTYIVTVTDANGCTDTSSISITEPPILVASFDTSTHVNCNGGSDGTATAIATGGTGAYTYSWPGGGTAALEGGLTAGAYIVTVTDANGCTDTALVNITEPLPLIASPGSISNVSCNLGNDGSASVNVSGGTAPYNYNWPSGSSSSSDSNLIAGSYIVTVTDTNGCSDTTLIRLTEPTPVLASINTTTNVSCNGGSDGSAGALASGGTAPYTFSWPSGNNGTTENNLSAGLFILTVTDANGCTDTARAIITEPTPLIVDINASTNVSCNGGNDGTASTIASGGTTPYQYSWPSGNTGANETGLAAGTYYVTLTDANGCTATDSVVIIEPTPLTSSIVGSVNVSCNGGNDGSASAISAGGSSPYVYNWSSGGTLPLERNLSAGTYTVTVTDSKGCFTTSTVTINEPPPLAVSFNITDVKCFGESNGRFEATVSGGTIPYTYLWSNGDQGPISPNLTAGNYTLTITDDNGCILDTTLTMVEPQPLGLTVTNNDTICIGNNFSLQAAASNGNGGYTYTWNQGLGTGNTKVVSPGRTTLYTVRVTDSKGCAIGPDSVMVYVRDLNSDTLLAQKDGDVCIGDSTQVFASHTGNLGPYNYQWNTLGSGLGPYTVKPRRNTTYVINVTDACGAIITDSIEVRVNDFPDVTLPDTIAEGCSPLTVVFEDSLNPTFNNVNYQWFFGNGSSASGNPTSYTYQNAGAYNVRLTATSSAGCEASSNSGGIVIVKPSPTANYAANPNPANIEDPVITFTNTSTGAIGFKWDFGFSRDSLNQSITITYPDTGTYPVILSVINSFGCPDTLFGEVIIEPSFEFDIPNAFTPNPNGGNGGFYNPNSLNNDVFFIFADYVQDFRMMIFNRWGELIFESNDLRRGWDGYYRDELCQQDVYVYKIEITWIDGSTTTKAGDVTLFR